MGAVAWGTAGIILVCGLGWAARGPITGLVAGGALLLSSTYREWSHQIMSETATVALVALAALLLQLASRTDRQPPRRLLLLGLGGVIGLAILVRLPNLMLLAALP